MGRAKQERELSLLARVDEATIKRSIARIGELSRGFNAAADAETRLDRVNANTESGLGSLTGETNASINALRKRTATTKLDIQAQMDALGITRKQTDAIEQQTRAQDKLNKEKQSGRGVSAAERAGSISSFTGSISALAGGGSQLGGAFNIVSDITQVAEYLPRLQEALTGIKAGGEAAELGATAASGGLRTLIVTLGPIAAVAAVAAGAYLLISKELGKGKKAAEEAVDSERQLAELRVKGSEEAIAAALEQARFERQTLEEQKRIAAERFSQFEGQNLGIGDLFNGTVSLETIGLFKETQKQVEGYNLRIEDQQGLISALTDLQGEYNREILTSAQLTENILSDIRERTTLEVELQRLIEEGTREDLERRRDAIEQQRELIAAQLRELEQFKDFKPFADEIERLIELDKELAEESRALNHEVLNAISLREKETAAIEAQKSALEKAQGVEQARADFEESLAAQEAKTLEERKAIIARANEELVKIETRRLEQISKLEQDFSISEARSERDHSLSIEKLQRESGEQETDIRADSAKRINDLEERAALERQRILEDYNDAASDAIQNRDAVALDAALRTRNRALKDNDRDLKAGVKAEKAALKERLDAAKQSNAQRIADLRQSYAIERADRLADFQQRIADINASAEQERIAAQHRLAESLAALEARNRAEIDKIKQGFADQLAEYGVFFTNLQQRTTAELNALALKWQNYFYKLSGSIPSSAGSGANSVGANNGGVTPTPAARGIRGFRNGTLLTGEDGKPELMRVRNGAVDVLSGDKTRGVFNSMAGAMRASSNSIVNNSVNMSAGAFQANLSGGDPVRMMTELRRMMRRDFPRILEETLEAALG